MIVLKEIEKIYQTKNSPQVVALKNINLTFESKGMVFITGKSGCGKSTLLNIIGALDSCTSGSMIIENKNINEFTEKELDNYRNSYVGFVFQEFHVLNAYNVYDNIRLAKELQQEKISEKELDAYLEKVSLTNLGKRKMNELSGGQKQRIAILRALIKNPRIILADEPTGNLDKINSKQIFEILKEISQEKLVIIVTHDLEAAQKYADRIIELKDGEIINDTKPTLNPEKTTLTLKESYLPFLFALKLAWNNLKRYPKKCILTIILFFISLLCCILLINSSLFNSTSLAIKLMNLNENYNIEVHKINYVQNTKWKEEWQSEEDQYLKNIYSGTTNPIYELYDFTTPLTFYLNTPQEPSKLFPTTPNITSYVEIKDPKILTNLSGSIPTSSNEIVIHEYLANYIINYGIKEKNGSWIPQNEEELLSKTHPIYLGDNEVYISGILKEETSYTEESLEDETTYAAYQNYIQKASTVYVKGFTNEVKLNQTKESTLNQFTLAGDHQQKLSFTALDTLQENESLLTIDALILGNSKFKEAYEEYLNANPLSTEEETKLWVNNYLKQYQTECNLFFQDFLNYQNIPITVKIIGIADENILSSSLVEKYMTTGKRKTGVLIHEENSHTLKKLLSNLNF
ncbi:TPA: ABC transporter ATP-binding protein [Candidatus Ventrenecus avicola]|nr:ABC transporter ATP-binding protein [Candidatus Ventrenecus avicola]